MCVGVPGQVVEVKGKRAKIQQGDHSHWVDISLIDGGVKRGDWLMTYQQAAINKISEEQAKEVIRLTGECSL